MAPMDKEIPRTFYLAGIYCHFGPTEYDNPAEALSRLKQVSTVAVYQEAFERLSHRMDGLPENFLVGSFIGGLKEEIRLEVRLQNPTRLTHAIGIARLVEEKVQLHKKPFSSTRTFGPSSSTRINPETGLLGPGPSSPLTTPALPAPPPIRRISSQEAKNRRERGLCYYCDDKYSPGHKCNKPQLFMIFDDPSSDATSEPPPQTADSAV